MDLLEKINRSFGSWYEGLFGGAGNDVRPKDILRRILGTLEDNRKEGFDNRIYVPNHYILEINVHDGEEKEYLLSFLDQGELETAIRRYCQQNHYHIRGTLQFEIREVEDLALDPHDKSRDKVRVKCRYNATNPATSQRQSEPQTPDAPRSLPPANGPTRTHGPAIVGTKNPLEPIPQEERTVASVYAQPEEEGGTVPSVAYGELMVYPPNRQGYRYTIARGTVHIGRSTRIGNDIVLDTDSQTSKQHARIELGTDGRFTLLDLGSTNGSWVNGRRLERGSDGSIARLLEDGDEIVLGATRLLFRQSRESDVMGEEEARGGGYADQTVASSHRPQSHELGSSGPAPPIREIRARTARLVLMDKNTDIDDFLLASETVIGRGVTNDIVLPDRSVATRHARIVHTGRGYTLESLGNAVTLLNGMAMPSGYTELLRDGDRIQLGELVMRFEGGQIL